MFRIERADDQYLVMSTDEAVWEVVLATQQGYAEPRVETLNPPPWVRRGDVWVYDAPQTLREVWDRADAALAPDSWPGARFEFSHSELF